METKKNTAAKGSDRRSTNSMSIPSTVSSHLQKGMLGDSNDDPNDLVKIDY